MAILNTLKSSNGTALATPKNIAVFVVVLLVLGFVGLRLASYFDLFGGPAPSTDPAVIDPTSNYTPEMKADQKKIEEQQIIEEQKPNRPPPAGS